ncbi:MAG: exodeoxyribonuclease III, partial [Candidatus Njordarchaeota archaeon]
IEYKLEAYDILLRYLENINRDIIIVGDFNIAHKPIDLARPEANENNIMFTLAERKMLNRLVMMGFVDAFRIFNKHGGNYTWWPRAYNARERNIGWRIDYIFVSENLKKNVKKALILSEVTGSDHCPVFIEIEI